LSGHWNGGPARRRIQGYGPGRRGLRRLLLEAAVKKRILAALATCALLLGLGMLAPAGAVAAPYCGTPLGLAARLGHRDLRGSGGESPLRPAHLLRPARGRPRG